MRLSFPPRLAAVLILALGLGGCASLPASIESQRTDALFSGVSMGMGMEEVTRALGPPDNTMKFGLSRTTAWDYNYQDGWGYIAIFSVTFSEDRRVVAKNANRVNTGGDHGSGP